MTETLPFTMAVPSIFSPPYLLPSGHGDGQSPWDKFENEASLLVKVSLAWWRTLGRLQSSLHWVVVAMESKNRVLLPGTT